jgi:hypothetical protein
MTNPIAPGQVEVYGQFSKHLGPRFMGAGLRLQFHYNQTSPGIYFKVAVSDEYRDAILKGIKDGMSLRFPDFPETGSIWITEVSDHPVDSSQGAFYLAARCAIELAYALTQLNYDKSFRQASTSDR